MRQTLWVHNNRKVLHQTNLSYYPTCTQRNTQRWTNRKTNSDDRNHQQALGGSHPTGNNGVRRRRSLCAKGRRLLAVFINTKKLNIP